MQRLAICRICLNENAQHVIVDTQLQKIYEGITTIPFQTGDMRPLMLCYICHGQLKASRRLMLKCLKAEELLTDMLNQLQTSEHEERKPAFIDRSALEHLSVTEIQQVIIDSAVQNVVIHVKEEIPIIYEMNVKLEEPSMQESPEGVNSIDSKPDHKQSPSDLRDDVKFHNSKKNMQSQRAHRKVIVRKKQRTGLKQAVAKKSRLQTVTNKSANDMKILNKYIDNQSDLKHCLSTEKTFVCDICKKIFKYKHTLIRHALVHTGEKPYVCNVCQMCFTSRCLLRRHTRTHTGEKPYVCKVCKKCFTTKYHLTRHNRIHTGEKPYVCNMCQKRFSEKDSLQNHLRLHTGEKPYVCDFCGKRFSKRNLLIGHARIHTGEKFFTCDVCGKDFQQKCYLIAHFRMHTGEKPFVCKVCDKRFSFKANLLSHTNKHGGAKPYVCNACKKAFNAKSNLKRHELIHTGERPYNCNICYKSFHQKSSLIIHARIHTGEKPYDCNVCDKSFGDKGTLNKHTRTHR